MRDDYTTNSHCLTHTIALQKVERMHFLSSGVKGLIIYWCSDAQWFGEISVFAFSDCKKTCSSLNILKVWIDSCVSYDDSSDWIDAYKMLEKFSVSPRVTAKNRQSHFRKNGSRPLSTSSVTSCPTFSHKQSISWKKKTAILKRGMVRSMPLIVLISKFDVDFFRSFPLRIIWVPVSSFPFFTFYQGIA